MGGVSVSVAGVDCERGADSLVIYNRAYGSSTGTNEYGREYIVRGGRVTDIRQNDSPIPADGVVISVHGTAADALAGVQVGDTVTIEENLGRAVPSASRRTAAISWPSSTAASRTASA